ncbi:MAG: hypothetical protein AAF501_15890, partial [Pseudomonadota bacterium]
VWGVVIFLLLGCALLAFIHLVRLPDGTALIDLRAFLGELRAEPSRYWWAYVMLFSTMLPTALHLCVASFGSTLKILPSLRNHIAYGLKEGALGDKVRGRWAVQWLCLSMTLTVMVPIMLVGLLWTNRGAIGLGLLDFFGWALDHIEALPHF